MTRRPDAARILMDILQSLSFRFHGQARIRQKASMPQEMNRLLNRLFVPHYKEMRRVDDEMVLHVFDPGAFDRDFPIIRALDQAATEPTNRPIARNDAELKRHWP